MRPFEFCVLGLSKLACFSAQTLRCPLAGGAHKTRRERRSLRGYSDTLEAAADELVKLRAENDLLRQGPPEIAAIAGEAQALIDKGELDAARAVLLRGRAAARKFREEFEPHSLGYRFRLHRKDLPGKPDLVFSRRRAVIFIHGCFWHQHPDPACLDARPPKSNTAYWNSKLIRNQERDAAHEAALKAQGWRVLVIWECETKDTPAIKARLKKLLS